MNQFALILLLAGFPALSTDMYLPAIPSLCSLWGITLTQANLSLVAFFLTFSLFLLIHGPLSDRYGRRPVLIAGVITYIIGSIACAASPGIIALVAARAVQAVGAAAASSVGLALIKDLYHGDERKKLLAYVGVIIPLCPMIAPTLGAYMMQYISWRGIFLSQSLLALPALYGSLRLKEPLAERGTGGIGEALQRYGRLLSNRPFLGYCLAFSLSGFAFFGFIGGSADIYISDFGMSEQTYGLYFSFNSFALMLGSFLCTRLVKVEIRTLLLITFMGMTVSAACIALADVGTALAFALPMFGYTLFFGMSRPMSNHLILEQVHRDTGSAASMITFFFFIVGAVAMESISLGWHSKPLFLAFTGMAGASIPLLTLLIGKLRRRTPPLKE